MLVNAYARAALVLVAAGLIQATGCRSAQTDRIRVLEAEKAEAERQNQELQHQQADLRADAEINRLWLAGDPQALLATRASHYSSLAIETSGSGLKNSTGARRSPTTPASAARRSWYSRGNSPAPTTPIDRAGGSAHHPEVCLECAASAAVSCGLSVDT